jgi:hypothetical protein
MIDAGAPSIKYEGERPLKKQEMLMAGPDWYLKRMQLLMDEYGYDYDEAGEIAYDSDKYYEVIGIDPGGMGDESRIMDEEVVEEGIMRAANGGVASQGGVKNYLGKQKMVTVPTDWKSAPDHPKTELAYITEPEKDLLLKADLHDSLNGGPNRGPEGVMSLNGWGSYDAGGKETGQAGGSGAGGKDDDTQVDRKTYEANRKAREKDPYHGVVSWQTDDKGKFTGQTTSLQGNQALIDKEKKRIADLEKNARNNRRKMDDLKRQDALDRNDPWVSTGTGKARFSTLSPAQKAAFLKEQEEQRAKGKYYNYNLDAEGNILGWQDDVGLKDWQASQISAGDTKLPPGVKPNIKYDTGMGSPTEKDD